MLTEQSSEHYTQAQRSWDVDMGNQCSAEKWISSAIFCWLALTQEIDFSPFVLSSLFNSTFRFQILEALNGQASVSGWWDITVGSVWDWDPWELQAHLLEASEQMTGRKLLQSPAQYPWSVCKFDLSLCFCSLYVVSVLSLFNYLLSHGPTLPPLCIQLSQPHLLIVSLYLTLVELLCLIMRLSWLLSSFMKVTKGWKP